MNYGKKKMMYGGMAKKKKMAVGGTTRERGPKGRRLVDVMTDEIFELSQSKSNATPAQIKEINKRIAEKKAGVKANAPIDKKTGKAASIGAIAAGIDFPDTIGKDIKYDTKSTIPTKKGTDKDKKSKVATKNYMETEELLKKERKREKKAGGSVKKKMAMGGKMKPVDKKKNPGLSKLPTEVRNKMGFMKKGGSTKKAVTEGMKKAAKTAAGLGAAIAKVKKKQGKKAGGMAKKKMMGGGMAMKYKKGGMTKKCPRDGIAMRGKTRA